MVERQRELEVLGHTVDIPDETQLFVDTPAAHDDLDADQRQLRNGFSQLEAADCVVVLNYPKNGAAG